MLRNIFYYLVIGVSILVVAGTLLSLLYHVQSWYLKLLDFPRLQFLITAVLLLVLFVLMVNHWKAPAIALVIALISAVVIQGSFLLPYTFLGKKTVAQAAKAEEENTVGIMIANVFLHNRNAAELLKIISATNPDMVLAMETDIWWVNRLAVLKKEYPYTILHPLNNTYGMALYSRFPLKESHIMFLSEPKVPSFHTKVVLPNGATFMFHGVHPVPPVPSKKHPDNIGEEEIALFKVGKMAAANTLADIVAGDYNDVSWSQTTRLFEAESGLNNVRHGRGLYNSFKATSPIWRWPLDHFFVTNEFSLLELERLPEFGSDHFPMFAKFVLHQPEKP